MESAKPVVKVGRKVPSANGPRLKLGTLESNRLSSRFDTISRGEPTGVVPYLLLLSVVLPEPTSPRET
jgi:hypothetical protein